tara:strand:- start:3073 stop:3663 length:591 start_codon:yes stop_codon:yes gene_type:complete
MSNTLSTNFFATASITSSNTTRVSESLSRKAHRRSIGGQHWMIQLSSKTLDRAELGALYSFLVKQQGQFANFFVIPPIYSSTASTNASGTPTITETFAAGQSQVRSQGGSGSLKAGDFIKFSNHDKVYMLTADVDQDASSEDYLDITPPLTTAITNSTTVVYNNVPFKVYLTDDRTRFQTNTDGTSIVEITVREDI